MAEKTKGKKTKKIKKEEEEEKEEGKGIRDGIGYEEKKKNVGGDEKGEEKCNENKTIKSFFTERRAKALTASTG